MRDNRVRDLLQTLKRVSPLAPIGPFGLNGAASFPTAEGFRVDSQLIGGLGDRKLRPQSPFAAFVSFQINNGVAALAAFGPKGL